MAILVKRCLDIMAAADREIPISPEASGDSFMVPSIAWVNLTISGVRDVRNENDNFCHCHLYHYIDSIRL